MEVDRGSETSFLVKKKEGKSNFYISFDDDHIGDLLCPFLSLYKMPNVGIYGPGYPMGTLLNITKFTVDLDGQAIHQPDLKFNFPIEVSSLLQNIPERLISSKRPKKKKKNNQQNQGKGRGKGRGRGGRGANRGRGRGQRDGRSNNQLAITHFFGKGWSDDDEPMKSRSPSPRVDNREEKALSSTDDELGEEKNRQNVTPKEENKSSEGKDSPTKPKDEEEEGKEEEEPQQPIWHTNKWTNPNLINVFWIVTDVSDLVTGETNVFNFLHHAWRFPNLSFDLKRKFADLPSKLFTPESEGIAHGVSESEKSPISFSEFKCNFVSVHRKGEAICCSPNNCKFNVDPTVPISTFWSMSLHDDEPTSCVTWCWLVNMKNPELKQAFNQSNNIGEVISALIEIPETFELGLLAQKYFMG